MLRPTDRILGPARGNEHEAISFAIRHARQPVYDTESGVVDYIKEVYRLAPLVHMDPAILIAQSAHETRDWTDPDFVLRKNPAGIGITDGPDFGYRWENGTDAARAQIVHMHAYAKGAIFPGPGSPLAPYIDLDPRYEEVFKKFGRGKIIVRTIADLTGKWATDPAYHTKIAAKGNALFPNIPDQQENQMSLLIPTFEKRIAPRGIPNRTNLWMNPEDVVIHEVGNMTAGADEEMHVRFVHAGGGQNVVSFHFIVGPSKVCQLFELDVACWHAGDGYNGRGNRRGIAIENVQIGDFDKTLWNLAWVCAELVVNPERFVWNGGVPDPYLITENDFNQHAKYMVKNCPQFIRERGLWPVLMGRIDQYIALFRNDQNQGPAPAPVPTPSPAPEPQPKVHTLPKGMSIHMARRLYERYDAPWGESFTFDLGRAAPQVWLARGKRSIPQGGKWSDEGTNWPAIDKVIRQGGGGILYQWVDGSVYETTG